MNEPKFDPDHIPRVLTAPHPLRLGIHGDTHTIEELRKIVNATEGLHDSLKQFIGEELGDIESNAAKIDLHLIDHPHGGVSLHLHIAPIHLGSRRPTVAPAVPADV